MAASRSSAKAGYFRVSVTQARPVEYQIAQFHNSAIRRGFPVRAVPFDPRRGWEGWNELPSYTRRARAMKDCTTILAGEEKNSEDPTVGKNKAIKILCNARTTNAAYSIFACAIK